MFEEREEVKHFFCKEKCFVYVLKFESAEVFEMGEFRAVLFLFIKTLSVPITFDEVFN